MELMMWFYGIIFVFVTGLFYLETLGQDRFSHVPFMSFLSKNIRALREMSWIRLAVHLIIITAILFVFAISLGGVESKIIQWLLIVLTILVQLYVFLAISIKAVGFVFDVVLGAVKFAGLGKKSNGDAKHERGADKVSAEKLNRKLDRE